MTIKRLVTTITALLAFIVVTSANAGTAAAEPELPPCQTTPWQSDVAHEFSTGSWGYLYRVIWCVEETQTIWAVSDVVPVLPDDSDCTWMETKAESLKPMANSDTWMGFHMGWFSCPDGTDEYPWAIITVSPDGTSTIQDQGTA
jgi:hypothetical protein